MKRSEFKNILLEFGKKNIAIMGHMGSGKSIIGKKLAKQLGFKHLDSDLEIIKLTNKSINQIFEEKGEKYFRIVETKVLLRLIEEENAIISLGGGSILDDTQVLASVHAQQPVVIRYPRSRAVINMQLICRRLIKLPVNNLLENNSNYFERVKERMNNLDLEEKSV